MAQTDRTPVPRSAESAPEPLDFFTSSWNRFSVLDHLRSRELSRAELEEAIEISRPTVSRILADLQDRGLIVRINDTYRATPRGAVVAGEVERCIRSLDTVPRLDGVLEWLPTQRLDFDLARLADAEVIGPDATDTTAPMRRLINHIEATSELRCVASGVTVEVVEAICEAAMDGRLTLECVLDERGLSGIRAHDELAAAFRKLVADGRCTVHRYPGPEDLVHLTQFRDVVMFCGDPETGRQGGILVSEDDVVQAWTTGYFDRLRSRSRRLDADAFTA